MAGIYIHIPFCKKRCLYCDFFSTTSLEKKQQYVDALIAEIHSRKQEIYELHLKDSIHTLYFGGGTPSLLSTRDLTKIITALNLSIPPKEITIEVNPDDISFDYCKQLIDIGFNRISMGIQSFSDNCLSILGRRHNAQHAITAVKELQKAGIKNISIDLMYALPNQTLYDWQKDLLTALQLNLQHISTYCLTLEPGTQLYHLYEKNTYPQPDETLCNDMFDMASDLLQKAGFQHYEVSNFCLPQYASLHNSNYWNGTPYIGIGAGAHSFNKNIRSRNVNNLNIYILQAKNNHFAPEKECLSEEQKKIETVMLGLRTSQGVNEKYINDKIKLNSFIKLGYLIKENNQVKATKTGWHILNFLIGNLI